nr:CarD family transcriptional regulator [uncultured Agathobaculum sp.]
MFQIGDKIVHPLHGAGMIEAIVERTIDGVPTKYYALKPIAGDTQLFIPTDACEKLGIRPVCSREAAEEFLNRLGGMPRSESKSWNQRYRENMLHIRSGNLHELGQVIKDLACRDKERGLSTGEKKMLASARQILASELSIALERPLTSVIAEIDRQL